ncbi:SCP2 sterol-binding domain-containing protein [Chloroflexota bacterium]
MASNARELIESMPDAFLPDKAGNAKALIALDLTGDGGGQWVVDVADGKCDVREEASSQPDVKVTMDADDFAGLTQGQLNPVQAFMSGKIKVSGNVGLVMQLMNWFKLG